MLTGTVALRTPPSPGQGDKMGKRVTSSLFCKESKGFWHEWLLVTFNGFQNLSFRSLPVDKEYINGNLGYELMQKLQHLRMTNRTLNHPH